VIERERMKSWLAGLIVAGVLFAPILAGASPRIRYDDNDTERVLDIERVTTELTQRRALFSIRTYDQFTADDVDHGSGFQFNLDTKQLDHDDFRLFLFYWLAYDQVICRLQTDHGLTIGERPANLDGNSISCGIPKWWLDIREPVQFTVQADWLSRYVDVAPDVGRYRRL
jgi:hypothetical protein